MNFFEHQDEARTRSGRLIVLFGGAILGITLAVYALGLGVLYVTSDGQFAPTEEVVIADHEGTRVEHRPVPSSVYSAGPWWWQPRLLFITMCIIAGSVGVGSWLKMTELRSGGSSVALSLGGRLIDPATEDPDERRLMNVVEEMAIASGAPVPQVFVLDHEGGINAFAAGWAQSDAAVAVTRGALLVLNRDELQGVIAHEFSHILNGDMRLNIRLIGLLHGILVIGSTGLFLLRTGLGFGARRSRSWTRSRNSEGGALPLAAAGLALWLIGSIGVFFGRLIQSAVSRQREFLADASAAQFTRNPSGLASALRKVGGLEAGSRVGARGADEMGHLFFGRVTGSWLDALASHPPLAERIRRLDPAFPGTFPRVEAPAGVGHSPALIAGVSPLTASERAPMAARPVTSPQHMPAQTIDERSLVTVRASDVVSSVGTARPEHVDVGRDLLARLPDTLRQATRHPLTAIAVVYAVMLDPDDNTALAEQLDVLRQHTDPRIHREVVRLARDVRSIEPAARLPLVELSMPALRRLSPEQAERVRDELRAVAEHDDHLTLAEYTLLKSVDNWMRNAHTSGPRRVQFAAMRPLLGDASVLVTAMALAGADDSAGAREAFDIGRQRFGTAWRDGVTFVGADHCTFGAIDRALTRFSLSSPAIKQRVVDAAAHAVTADERVTVAEAELLRTFADALACPLPPFLRAPTPAPAPATSVDAPMSGAT